MHFEHAFYLQVNKGQYMLKGYVFKSSRKCNILVLDTCAEYYDRTLTSIHTYFWNLSGTSTSDFFHKQSRQTEIDDRLILKHRISRWCHNWIPSPVTCTKHKIIIAFIDQICNVKLYAAFVNATIVMSNTISS